MPLLKGVIFASIFEMIALTAILTLIDLHNMLQVGVFSGLAA